MNALTLKIIAVIAMTLDHIGCIYGTVWLRMVGRLALPIFAFLIANGFKHTSSVKNYALRLFAFAAVSEIPFDLFASGEISFVKFSGILPNLRLDNVFFTLLLGLGFLYFHGLYKKRGFKYAPLFSVITFIALGSIAAYVSTDYGAVGVAWVALFGIFDVRKGCRNKIFAFLGGILLASWKHITTFVAAKTGINFALYFGVNFFLFSTPGMAMQPLAALALIPILLYNGKSGAPRSNAVKTAVKYGFYLYYPLHLLVLYFIAR